ncbi:MAG: D-alanine--D-alanine ligase [Acidimicrobiales bacterium]|nr:D-alanine--D-alanine ligase [Acidimicrobiales bacterium]MCB9395250.1 D-alanine--D-alanine ligase [Acidimicrobiaceae bacterium]
MSSPDPAPPHDDRIELIVLFGGQSAEHDVSCTTAAHVLRAADPTRYRITPIGIDRDGRWHVAAEAQAALAAGPDALPGRLDPSGAAVDPTAVVHAATAGVAARDEASRTVVMPLLHGPMGEDGTVQGLLELAGVPYVGSGVLGSSVSMDKAMAKQVLAANGIAQARWRAFREHEVTPGLPAQLADDLGLPLFVKPANMGSSVGVSKAKTVEQVRDAIGVALGYDEWVVVEEAISGREIEVAVLGNLEPRASVPGEIVPGAEFYDYADKYLDDGSQAIIPARLSPEAADDVRHLAVEVFRLLRCDGLARVDFFYEDGPGGRGFLCNEVNTIPGFTPISMYPKLWIASGMSYPELIDELVRLALDRATRRRRNTER